MRTTYLQWSYLTYLTGNCIAFTITLQGLWWSPELAIYKQIRAWDHPGFKVTLKLKYFNLNNKFLREIISFSLLLRFYMQKLQKRHIFLQKKKKEKKTAYAIGTWIISMWITPQSWLYRTKNLEKLFMKSFVSPSLLIRGN